MRLTKLLAAATLLSPVLASAQAVPTQVVITFDVLNLAVPVAGWLPAAAAALLIGATLVWRKRTGAALRSLLLASAAALAATSFVQVRDASAAIASYPITLAASPTSTTVTENVGVATNASGQRIRLTSVTVVQSQGQSSSQACQFAIVPATTTCNVGTELAQGATCQIEVQCPN